MTLMEPTQEQWKKLYEISVSIKALRPRENFLESELIAIQLPELEEPVFCSVLGSALECSAILFFVGYEALQSYYKMYNSADEPDFILLSYQNCLSCNFGGRDEIDDKDYEIIKNLNLKFRGKNQWIYFRSLKAGYHPWHISCDQAEVLINVFSNFAEAYKSILSDKKKVDFENHNILMRTYNSKEKKWINSEVPMPQPPQTEYEQTIIMDELLTAKLKKQKRSHTELEIDSFYLPTPIQEHKEDIPYYPLMCIIVDETSSLFLNQHILDGDESEEDVIIKLFTDIIMQHGRPHTIYLRNNKMEGYLNDICTKIGIKIKISANLDMIDHFVSSFLIGV